MLTVNIAKASPQQYRNLVQYILSNCDEISFHLPCVYSDGQLLDHSEYQEYYKANEGLLRMCYQHGGRKTVSRDYCGMKLGQHAIIITVKPFAYLQELLVKNHLFDWLMQNGLPEDVCFFSKGKLLCFTCSHEEEFYIERNDEKDIRFLRENAFEFWKHKK